MVDDIAWSPPQRRNGTGWIVLSGLLLPAGWIAWGLMLFSEQTGVTADQPTLPAQIVARTVTAVVCAGVPLVGAVRLLVARRGDSSVTLVGPVACVVFALIAVGTIGTSAVGRAVELSDVAHRRAQPPTARETSRTQEQAQADLTALGERTVTALGESTADGEVETLSQECGLSNLTRGTEYSWVWTRGTVGSTLAGIDPQPLPAQALGARLAAAQSVLEQAGLRAADTSDGSIVSSGAGWAEHGSVQADPDSRSVSITTTCLVGGPGDAGW